MTGVAPGPRPFRWLGKDKAGNINSLLIARPDPDAPNGILNVTVPPGAHPDHATDPKCNVRRADNLAALGPEKIAKYITDGLAVPLED